MKKICNYIDGITGFAWVLILGLIASMIFATKLVMVLWNVEGFTVFFCFLIWALIAVVGAIVSFVLAYIFHKLFE